MNDNTPDFKVTSAVNLKQNTASKFKPTAEAKAAAKLLKDIVAARKQIKAQLPSTINIMPAGHNRHRYPKRHGKKKTSATPTNAANLPPPELFIDAYKTADIPRIIAAIQVAQQNGADYEYYIDVLPAAFESCENEAAFVDTTLQIIQILAAKENRSRVDVCHVVVVALEQQLREQVGVKRSDCFSVSQIEVVTLLLRSSTHLSAKTFIQLAETFKVEISQQQLVDTALNYFQQQRLRDAADIIVMYASLYDVFPKLDLLLLQLAQRKYMDVLHRLTDGALKYYCKGGVQPRQSDAFRTYLKHVILACTTTKQSDAAIKLIHRYELHLVDFPDLLFEHRKSLAWWCVAMGKCTDFKDMLLRFPPELDSTAADEYRVRLQHKLCTELARGRCHGQMSLCKRLIHEWQLEVMGSDEQRQHIVNLLHNLRNVPDDEVEISSESTNFTFMPEYKFADNCIIFVNSAAALSSARDVLVDQRPSILGFDTEYISEGFQFLDDRITRCQILQVACPTHAFLFDIQLLHPNAEDASLRSQLADLLLAVFSDHESIKVGMSFKEDWKRMHAEFHSLPAFQTTLHRFVDLQPALRQLPLDSEDFTAKVQDRKDSLTKLPSSGVMGRGSVSGVRTGGLQRLCRSVLGVYLDKYQQLSNWSLRPLRADQLRYAAVDAHCEIEIFKRLKEQGIAMEEDEIDCS